MRSRLLTLLVAVLTGAVAVAMVYLYVQRVEEDTTRGLGAFERVLVAGSSFSVGDTGDEIRAKGALIGRPIPELYVAPGAILESNVDWLNGKVLDEELVAGEQITEQHFAGTASEAFARRFPEGTQALSLPVEDVRGVAGHISAGDNVNAFAPKESGGATLIAGHIPVIEFRPASPDDIDSLATVVLAVSAKNAARLIDAQERVGLWYTLIPEPSP